MCEENKPQDEKVVGGEEEIVKETPVMPEQEAVAPEVAPEAGLPVEEKVIEEGAEVQSAPETGNLETPAEEKVLEDKPEAPEQA
jgi:hypothetical protein